MFHYFNEAQWYIKKTKEYGFASKGGNNGEPHNHNDIGSFMLVCKDEVIISDLGRGIYTRQTLAPETRYDYVQNSSRGHSVPIINGEYQKVGAEYKANNVKATNNEFSLDIESAYESGIIKTIHRSFSFGDDRIILKDLFEFSDNTGKITERFVSKIPPEITEDAVFINGVKLIYDSQHFKVSLSTEEFFEHNGIDKSLVYFVDFEPLNEEQREFILEILFD